MANGKDEILSVLQAQADAIARGDAEGAVAAMAPDIVSYDLPPPLEHRGAGTGAVEGLRDWFTTWENGVTVEMPDPQIFVDGNLACVFGLSRMRGIKKGRGLLDQWSRRTMLLRRAGHGGSSTSMGRFRCGWTEATPPRRTCILDDARSKANRTSRQSSEPPPPPQHCLF